VTQSGYNICNSTTSGPDAQCQTLVANNASDFCLWGSPTTDATGTMCVTPSSFCVCRVVLTLAPSTVQR